MNGLSVAPEVLLWSEEATGLRRSVEQEYEVLLHAALQHVGQALSAEPEDAPSVDELRQVLLAPRTVRRLLWPRRAERARTHRFLESALAAERALRRPEARAGFTGWTADGRAFIRANGAVAVQPSLDERVPLDMRSPHARSVDLAGGSRHQYPARPTPPATAAGPALAQIQEAWGGIRASPGAVAGCVAAWTRVLVVQFDASGKFWSGSNGQYVGRVVLANAGTVASSVEVVADALVHEAIHGFLYMHESVEPWVRGYSLYTDAGAIESPWSGTLLPVRPYIQACFVWYGLAMFWAQHLGGEVFDRSRAGLLLNRALGGFRRGSLADRLQPWQSEIRPEVTATVDELQRIVVSLLQ